MTKRQKLDATKTGFPKSLVKTCKNDFELFKKWFNENYTGAKADEIWAQLTDTKSK